MAPRLGKVAANDRGVLAPSISFATNSPHASGPHGFYGDTDEHGEERMPTLSTWREPTSVAPDGWFARQLKAGLLGLVLGLVGVIPTVLWLTGHIGSVADFQSLSIGSSVSSDVAPVPGKKEAPVLLVAPQPVERPAAEADSASETESVEELLGRAHAYIGEGNMVRAREILSEAALADNPEAAFALAETYDPNILAATAAQGARAEVERARMLYGKALAGGVAAARKRLDGLK